MQHRKKGYVFGHIDKFWKGHDPQIKKNACKNVYLRSIFIPEKYVFRVCFEGPFTRMISSLKYKWPPGFFLTCIDLGLQDGRVSWTWSSSAKLVLYKMLFFFMAIFDTFCAASFIQDPCRWAPCDYRETCSTRDSSWCTRPGGNSGLVLVGTCRWEFFIFFISYFTWVFIQVLSPVLPWSPGPECTEQFGFHCSYVPSST